jgi:LacI family transcriptional regulator
MSKPSAPPTTLTAVAKAAGVSVSTASVVLNRRVGSKPVSAEAADRVWMAADRLGYVANFHAQAMKIGRSQTIGIAIDIAKGESPVRSELAQGYFGTLVGAIEVAARTAGYALLMVGPKEGRSAAKAGIDAAMQRRVDGLILLGTLQSATHEQYYDEPPTVPLVAVEYERTTTVPVVTWDLAHGVRIIIDHLMELGHRRVLWVDTAHHTGTDKAGRRQLFIEESWKRGLQGYVAAYDGVPDRSRHVQEGIVDAGFAATRDFIRDNPTSEFTAVVAYNDLLAIGAMRALLESGRHIPEDVSVVGFDNLEAPLARPKLTSVDHVLVEMGVEASRWLIEMIESESGPESFKGRRSVIRPRLVVRESTGPAKQA